MLKDNGVFQCNWRISVEPAKFGASPPKVIPGPVDADEYERTHNEQEVKE